MSISTDPHILVADDHAMMRDGMVLMIRTAWPEGVCDVAHDYLSVVNKLEAQTTENRFDAVILDLRMPGMRGVESVEQITQRAVGIPVIVCTALEDPSLVQRLLTSGVYCAVNKTKGADELLTQLRTALQMPRRIDAVKDDVGSEQSGTSQSLKTQSSLTQLAQQGSSQLTPRQREILKQLHTGKPSKVIASQLGIGLGTIKSHLHTLYSVMEVSNRSEAIVKSQNWLL
jgi:DNA-binding NarL/FixJ family response regulator